MEIFIVFCDSNDYHYNSVPSCAGVEPVMAVRVGFIKYYSHRVIIVTLLLKLMKSPLGVYDLVACASSVA